MKYEGSKMFFFFFVTNTAKRIDKYKNIGDKTIIKNLD